MSRLTNSQCLSPSGHDTRLQAPPLSPPHACARLWQGNLTETQNGSRLFPQQIKPLFSEALWMADGGWRGSRDRNPLYVFPPQKRRRALWSSELTKSRQNGKETSKLQASRSSQRSWGVIVAHKTLFRRKFVFCFWSFLRQKNLQCDASSVYWRCSYISRWQHETVA